MKHSFLISILCLAIWCYCLPLRAIPKIASNYFFTHITNDQGLSHSHVKAILQDNNGFMWFGTANRLNRYDGSSIINFNCYDDSIKEGNNNINSLYEDSKHRIWIGTDRGIYIYDPRSEQMKKIVSEDKTAKVPFNWVESMTGTPDGDIWCIVPDEGVYRFVGGDEKQCHLYSVLKDEKVSVNGSCIDETGTLWIGSNKKGLFRYNSGKDSFEHIKTDNNGYSIQDIITTSLCKWRDEILVTSYAGELYRYHPKQNLFRQIPITLEQSSFFHMVKVKGDEIWQGTNNGIYVINLQDHSCVHLKMSFNNPFSLSDDNISSIYFDNKQGLWIGTALGGVSYLSSSGMQIDKYTVTGEQNSLSSNHVRSIAKDSLGNIWIGTEDKGLNVLNAKTGEITRFPYPKNDGIDHSHIVNLYVHNGFLYCSLFRQGMDIIRLSDRSLRHTTERALEHTDGVVWSMWVDHKNRTWLGSGGGLYMSQAGKHEYQPVPEIGSNWIFYILETKEGNLWFCSRGNGIWMLEAATNKWHRYQHIDGDDNSLSSNAINSAMQDSKGRIWFSTERGGICKYRPETDDFISYSIAEGVPDDITYTVVEDAQQNLWFGTNRGLVKFEPDTENLRIFTAKDGLLGNQFNYHSALMGEDGKLYLGGLNGLIAFAPLLQETEQVKAPVFITRLSIYNKQITPITPDSPLDSSIMYADRLTLSYDQNNLSLGVVLPDYDFSGSVKYFYCMEPIDKDWVTVSDHRDISFAHLPPGKYTFKVMASRGDLAKTAVRTLDIEILPPWWRSGWMYLIYVLFVTGTLLGWFLRYRRRKDRQMKEQLKLFAIEKEKELNESKVNFFTQIAHEVRTPLTLINGPLEAIFEMKLGNEKLNKYLSVISLNTKRLLELTTQLLDFQKTGASKWIMRFEKTNMAALLHEILVRFEPTIIKEKKLMTDIPEGPVWAVVDRESIIKIISNLLNNALKYGDHKIEVSLTSDAQHFSLKISNDGERIPANQLSQIFDPFYQINKENVVGFGIGLSLAHSLVELHKGELFVDETSPENTFVLNIPLKQEAAFIEPDHLPDITEDELSHDIELPELSEIDWKNVTVLLVEDNEQLLEFLSERLRQTFTVIVAHNGKEALDILKETSVNLIVTDIMMPVMDGYELCMNVKQNIDICHIPIVLLTAKNDLNSKIKGLKLGAEAYVEKPFSFGYLESQILSLLNNRMREREAFSKRPLYSTSHMQMNEADKEFVQEIEKLIDENLDNIEFSIEDLAQNMNMSRSTLLRKFKSLFNLSPVKFLQLYRLKRAAYLIQQGKYRIAEIYPMVGFSSNSYFTRVFIEQFGMSPKSFEMSQKKDSNKDAEI